MTIPKTKERTSIKGTVDRVYFENNNFTIGRLICEKGKHQRFKGRLTVQPGESVTLNGSWTKAAKFGWQFNVTSHQVTLDLSRDGLCKYLANNPDFEGIGPKKAALIADNFWANFEEVLFQQPEALKETAKVPDETVAKIQEVWRNNQGANNLLAHLASFDLTHAQASALVRHHGPHVVDILRRDPYLIIGRVAGFGFKRVDQIAQKMGIPKNAECRIHAALVFLVEQEFRNGHSYIHYDVLIQEADEFLGFASDQSHALIENCLEQALEENKLTLVHLVGQEMVALPLTVRWEQGLLKSFSGAWNPNPHFDEEDIPCLVETLEAEGNQLLQGQRRAVVNALKFQVSVMTGGAGSGKTYTIQSIHQLCTEHGLRVALCAPTGKAAKRMEQVVGVKAGTVHRLLRYDGKGFKQFDLGPIEADVIIVDEFSMVDTQLAHALFKCVDPNKTAVMIVGDHNQIEPVGAGNVLRDLIQSQAIPTVILDEVVRQAGELKSNSVAILKGEVRPTSPGEGTKPWYFADQYESPAGIHHHLVTMYEGLLELRFGIDTVKDTQILTPTRKGSLGTDELNKLIQATVQKHFYNVQVQPTNPKAKPLLLPFDKVIQTRNDYEIGVMNGAVGYVEEVTGKQKLVVTFDDRTIELGPKQRLNLELAYALTIHKSQGSEYKCAIVIAADQHSYMNNRNLLYTAVTRARDTVILMSNPKAAEKAASKRVLNHRRTFLSHWLKEAAKPSQGVQDV